MYKVLALEVCHTDCHLMHQQQHLLHHNPTQHNRTNPTKRINSQTIIQCLNNQKVTIMRATRLAFGILLYVGTILYGLHLHTLAV